MRDNGEFADPAWPDFGFCDAYWVLVNNKRLIDLAAFLLIAVILLVGYKLSPMILPQADIALEPDPACDIQRGPCALELPDGGRLLLSLGDQPVPLLQPFPVRAQFEGTTPGHVAIEFDGEDMSMGLNRAELMPAEGGAFTGSATLPVCVTGRMVWRATVMVEAGRQRIAAPFLFTSGGDHDGEAKP